MNHISFSFSIVHNIALAIVVPIISCFNKFAIIMYCNHNRPQLLFRDIIVIKLQKPFASVQQQTSYSDYQVKRVFLHVNDYLLLLLR